MAIASSLSSCFHYVIVKALILWLAIGIFIINCCFNDFFLKKCTIQVGQNAVLKKHLPKHSTDEIYIFQQIP